MSSKLVLCYFCLAALTSYMFQIAATSPSPTVVLGSEMRKNNIWKKHKKMPITCLHEDICFDDDKYPTELVENLMQDTKVIDHITKSVERDGDIPLNSCPSSDCPAECINNKPVYYILDENNKVRVVVQSKNLQQIVNITRCRKEGLIVNGTKNIVNPEFFSKYKLTCATKYLKDYVFIVVSENGKHLEMVRPVNGIPICCTCRSELKD